MGTLRNVPCIACSRVHRTFHQIVVNWIGCWELSHVLLISRIQINNPFPKADFFLLFPFQWCLQLCYSPKSELIKLKTSPVFYRKTWFECSYFSTVGDHLHLSSFAVYITVTTIYFDWYFRSDFLILFSILMKNLRLREVNKLA